MANNVDAINLSGGSLKKSFPNFFEKKLFQEAQDKGIKVFVSAGNSGRLLEEVRVEKDGIKAYKKGYFPQQYKGAVTVGAVEKRGETNYLKLAPYSNFGKLGSEEMEEVALGDVYSTDDRDKGLWMRHGMKGTSFAAPQIAREYLEKKFKEKNPNFDWDWKRLNKDIKKLNRQYRGEWFKNQSAVERWLASNKHKRHEFVPIIKKPTILKKLKEVIVPNRWGWQLGLGRLLEEQAKNPLFDYADTPPTKILKEMKDAEEPDLKPVIRDDYGDFKSSQTLV